jgi:hypothetical protein
MNSHRVGSRLFKVALKDSCKGFCCRLERFRDEVQHPNR